MRKYSTVLAACLVITLMSGCGKRDSITTIKSPIEGVFYTIEISKSVGLASDTTRVYAHLERDGKARKILVLAGEDLTVAKIIWNNPHDATLCLDGGITDTFRNEVTLIVGDNPDDSETIYNHLRDHCNASPTASPNGG
jgi:hypothetical protein